VDGSLGEGGGRGDESCWSHAEAMRRRFETSTSELAISRGQEAVVALLVLAEKRTVGGGCFEGFD